MINKIMNRLSSKSKQVTFVFAEEYRTTGATIMRGEQLVEMVKKYMPRIDVDYRPLGYDFKNQILFLTKGAIYNLDEAVLEKLKKNGNRLIFDTVEAPLPHFTRDYADIVVACSAKSLSVYEKTFPNVQSMLLDHHVDPRVQQLEMPPRSKLKIGYFGEFANTFISDKIRSRVDFIEVDNLRQDPEWINKLPAYPMHYAIRVALKPNRYKPFLKGFTAAHCDANVLVQDTETDALRWLGEDYTYLIKGEVNGTVILAALDKVEQSYGSKEWRDALEVMRHIKEATSERAIADQLAKILKQAMN